MKLELEAKKKEVSLFSVHSLSQDGVCHHRKRRKRPKLQKAQVRFLKSLTLHVRDVCVAQTVSIEKPRGIFGFFAPKDETQPTTVGAEAVDEIRPTAREWINEWRSQQKAGGSDWVKNWRNKQSSSKAN